MTTKVKQRRYPSPKEIANLVPCKPGETHNPNGRPKGSRNVSTVLKEMLGEIAPEITVSSETIKLFAGTRKLITNADAIACVLYDQAMKGELPAIREVLDRTEGKAQQSIEITTDPKVLDLKAKIQQRADEKKTSYEVELQLYLEHFAGDIQPEIKDKLASELVQ